MEKCDGIYLFANLSALDFYRKMGFEERTQYQYTLKDDVRLDIQRKIASKEHINGFVKLDSSDEKSREKYRKAVRNSIVYGAFDIIKEKEQKDPLEVFEAALENVMPVLEVKARRVGGATYQVPIEIRPERRQTLGLRWLVSYARNRHEKTMAEKLAGEIIDAVNGNGGAFKKKEDTHRMAEANKAFAHYKW